MKLTIQPNPILLIQFKKSGHLYVHKISLHFRFDKSTGRFLKYPIRKDFENLIESLSSPEWTNLTWENQEFRYITCTQQDIKKLCT